MPHTQLPIIIYSFGFKHGMPEKANLLFDVRFLPNPYWVSNLQPLSGLDLPVQTFLAQEPMVHQWLHEHHQYLLKWLPQFQAIAQDGIIVAIGCTGGQHRSVYLAEKLAKLIQNDYPLTTVQHRDHKFWEL